MDAATFSDEVDWPEIWRDVAGRLGAHRVAGRGHLLTEDVVRMETVLALAGAGVPAARLAAEYLAPQLVGGKLDLVVDPPDGVVVEFKYPRDSRTGFSPETMTLGELVRDFLRVAAVPARQRWVVQVLNPRLQRYLRRLVGRHGLDWAFTEGDDLRLSPDVVVGLPSTAVAAVGRAVLPETVMARCAVAAPVDDGLVLYGYLVDGPPVPAVAPTSTEPVAVPLDEPASPPAAGATRGARHEILQAVAAITTRSGRSTFTLAEVVAEMRGSRYAESTVRTMVSSHLCAQAQGPGIDSHTDFDRVERGVYQLRPR